MRKYILLISLLLNKQHLLAQSEKQVEKWLYNLPVAKSPVSIRKAILKNNIFEDDRKEQSRYFANANSTYRGTILSPFLPKSGSIDSAKIYLSIGSLQMQDGYSGDMKWLRFEYFSTDTVFLNSVFDSACVQLKETSINQKFTGHRTKNNDAIGKGLNFIYTNDPMQYRSISATRVRYSSGKQSFLIIYSGSDN